MALFGRRRLQRILDENVEFLTENHLTTACNLLNTPRDDYIATEWEQVILNAASKLGRVDYEPKMKGSRTPDLLFRSNDPPIEFIADITSASDKGLNKLNPFEALNEELWRYLRMNDLLSTGGFHVQVDRYQQAVYRGSKTKVRLKLPKRAEFEIKIFNSGFRAFLGKVRQYPQQQHRFDAIGSDTGVHFTYDPRAHGRLAGGHPSFDVASIIDSNPVYNALKSKGDQLKATGFSGFAGVILCDGGCQMLRSTMSGWQTYRIEEIIRLFLSQFDSVAFVATFVVKELSSFSSDRHLLVEHKLYLNPKHAVDNLVLAEMLVKLHKLLPEPQFTPENALARVKSREAKGRYYGKIVMGSTVKMSARLLSEVLAGRTTVQDFYGMKAGENPFDRMLAAGRLITKVTIEPNPNEDDDTVTIEFGEPDVAVSQFRVLSKP